MPSQRTWKVQQDVDSEPTDLGGTAEVQEHEFSLCMESGKDDFWIYPKVRCLVAHNGMGPEIEETVAQAHKQAALAAFKAYKYCLLETLKQELK